MGRVEREGKQLPLGVQYIAPHGGDARLFAVGKKKSTMSVSKFIFNGTRDNQVHL